MLQELTPKSVSFDTHTDSTVIHIGAGGKGAPSPSKSTLLVDGDGCLVGIDLRRGAGQGWVVMLGAHEDVAKSVADTSVDVAFDGDGKPGLVRVRGYRARGAEMSIL